MLAYTHDSIENLFQLPSLQAIVDNVGSLIHHDMVISNKAGMIIAATARERIGRVNEELRQVLLADGDQHIVTVHSKTGFRPGINLTLRYENRPVGAVGVTGDPEGVAELAPLVRAMVQQQIYDLSRQISIAEHQRIISDFVYSWLYKSEPNSRIEYELRGRTLGIDITLPRVICIIDSRDYESPESIAALDQTGERIFQYVEKRLMSMDDGNIVTMLNNRITVLLHTETSKDAYTCMLDLQKSIQYHFGIRCAIGISHPYRRFDSAKNRYEIARQACRTSMRQTEKNIFIFGPYDLEPLLSTINPEDEERIYRHFFREFKSEEQIAEAVMLLENYILCNRSISEVAVLMSMHKNTVQSRLDKIQSLTGYNPRNTKDLAYIYVITLIHRIRKGQHST